MLGHPFRKQFWSPGLNVTTEHPGALSQAMRHCVRLRTGALLLVPSCTAEFVVTEAGTVQSFKQHAMALLAARDAIPWIPIGQRHIAQQRRNSTMSCVDILSRTRAHVLS